MNFERHDSVCDSDIQSGLTTCLNHFSEGVHSYFRYGYETVLVSMLVRASRHNKVQ